MDPIRNPFVPGAGASPPELIGREELLHQAQVAFGRIKAGRPAKSFIAIGLRGVGKTVLLNHIRDLARDAGYRTCVIEAHEGKPLAALLVPQFRRLLLELDRIGALSTHVKRGLRVLKSFMSGIKFKVYDTEVSLDIDAELGAADSGDLEADLPELFAAVGHAAQDRGLAVALLIDEIQYLPERDMSALIMAMHRMAQDQLPVMMVAAGLPQVVGLSGRSKSYAERLFDFPSVDPLSPADATRALVEPAAAEGVAFTPEAVAEIVRITQGYPYFLQEWGYHAWNIAQASPITIEDVRVATAQATDQLDRGFFRVRFDRLTPRERDYVRAMAALGPGPHRSGDIADHFGVRVQSLGPLRSSLIAKGMIYSPAHGDTAFTVPMFDAFLHRTMPDWAPSKR
jgi:AAA ATPase domain